MFRIIKKEGISKRKHASIVLAALLLALVVNGFFLMFLGHNPINVYGSMIKGAFLSNYRVSETLIKSIPLIITSIGISLAFKMKFWNIGAEGQIIMGAFGASFVALNYPGLPQGLLLSLMGLAAMICGGLWSFIPAYFKAKFKTNETIFTLMLNYIALKWITYLQYGPWKDPKSLGFPKIPNFCENAILPKLFGIHVGWVIALFLAIWAYFFFNHTKKGYEIAVVGESENTAVYAGMNVKKILIRTMFFSGAICGLSGMIGASAVSKTLSVEISGGVGYTAIIVSWLSYLNPFLIIIVSILFAAMIQGASYIQMAYQIPQSVALILQGLILFFVLGSEFFSKYKIVLNRARR